MLTDVPFNSWKGCPGREYFRKAKDENTAND